MVKQLCKAILWVALTISAGVVSAQDRPQIPNSDFELWTSVDNHEPDNWNSFETSGGSFAMFSKAQQVAASEETRPGSDGKYSAVIWARNVFIVIAQGNLTLGQIQAGDITPSNKANHNKAITADENFSQKLGALPKAIAAWVKFVPKEVVETVPYARISATVHDSYDYIEYGTAEAAAEDPENASHIVAHAEQNFRPSTDGQGRYQWQRLEIPFSTEGYTATDPAYIIVNLTTNAVPGGGSEGDSLYIDDIELIYEDPVDPDPDYTGLLADSYSGSLVVSVDGNAAPASREHVRISKKEDGTIDLGLDNFKLVNGISEDGNIDYMFVGNIRITDIPLTSEDGRIVNFVKEQNIVITEGSEPEGVLWLGPMLSANGGIPVSIQGTVEGEDLELEISISMAMGSETQEIQVHFTTKDDAPEPDYTELLADSYTGLLAVTINGEPTPSTQEVIHIVKKAGGKIDLALNNFKLISDVSEAGEISYMFIGNILVTDIQPASEDGNRVSISKRQNIFITEGTVPSDAFWVGPSISGDAGIPVQIEGTAENGGLELGIDIEFELAPGTSMQIHVDFSTSALENGIEVVRPAVGRGYAVYTLNGLRVAAGEGEVSFGRLPKGVYIVEHDGIRTKVLNR